MGLFSSIKKGLKKLGRGIKKGIKKVSKAIGLDGLIRRTGRAIKKGLSKFGEFMGKIGVLGQIAVTLFLPAIGGALLKSVGWVSNTLAGIKGANIAAKVARGIGKIGQFATKAVTKVGNVYRNITKGVADTIKNFSKAMGNKIANVLPDGKLKSFFANAGPETFFNGKDSAFSRSFGEAGRLNYKNLGISEDDLLTKVAEVDLEIALDKDPNAIGRQAGDISITAADGTEGVLNVEDIRNAKGETIFKNTLELDDTTGLRKFSPSKGDIIVSDTSGREFFADASSFEDLSDLKVFDENLSKVTEGPFKFTDVSDFKEYIGGKEQEGFFSRFNPIDEAGDTKGMTVMEKIKSAPARATHKLLDTVVDLPSTVTERAAKDAVNMQLQKEIMGDQAVEVTNVTYQPSPAVATGEVYSGSSYSGELPSYANYTTNEGAYGYNAHRYAQDSWNTYNNYRQSIGMG